MPAEPCADPFVIVCLVTQRPGIQTYIWIYFTCFYWTHFSMDMCIHGYVFIVCMCAHVTCMHVLNSSKKTKEHNPFMSLYFYFQNASHLYCWWWVFENPAPAQLSIKCRNKSLSNQCHALVYGRCSYSLPLWCWDTFIHVTRTRIV